MLDWVVVNSGKDNDVEYSSENCEGLLLLLSLLLFSVLSQP